MVPITIVNGVYKPSYNWGVTTNLTSRWGFHSHPLRSIGAEDCSTAEGERSCNKHGVATWDEGPGPTTGKSWKNKKRVAVTPTR